MKTLTETARRHAIVFLWGYGGDIVNFLSAVAIAFFAGVRSFFDIEYARDVLSYE